METREDFEEGLLQPDLWSLVVHAAWWVLLWFYNSTVERVHDLLLGQCLELPHVTFPKLRRKQGELLLKFIFQSASSRSSATSILQSELPKKAALWREFPEQISATEAFYFQTWSNASSSSNAAAWLDELTNARNDASTNSDALSNVRNDASYSLSSSNERPNANASSSATSNDISTYLCVAHSEEEACVRPFGFLCWRDKLWHGKSFESRRQCRLQILDQVL